MEDAFVFAWDNFIFSLSVNGSRVYLQWKSISECIPMQAGDGDDGKEEKHPGTGETNCDINDDGDGGQDDDDAKGKPTKGHLSNSSRYSSISKDEPCDDDNETALSSHNITFFEFGEHCEVHPLSMEMSFDPSCFQNVPVCSVRCCNKSKATAKQKRVHSSSQAVAVLKVSKQELLEDLDHRFPGEAQSDADKQFYLTEVRKYLLSGEHGILHRNLSSSSSRSSRTFVINNFTLGITDVNNNSIHLFVQSDSTLPVSSQSFYLRVNEQNDNDPRDLKILSTLAIPSESAFVVLLGSQKECSAYYFSLQETTLKADSSNYAELQYDMTPISVSKLFPTDLSDILQQVKIISFSQSPCEGCDSVSSSVVMITKTGFSLYFVDGVMQGCVSLSSADSTDEAWTLPSHGDAPVDILHFNEPTPRTAVLFHAECFLIDWSKEKIIKCWLSVAKVLQWTCTKNGCPKLIVIHQGESNFDDSSAALSGVRYHVCDVEDLVGIGVRSDRKTSEERLQEDDVVGGEEDGGSRGPECALNALLAQCKMCQSAVQEAESAIQCKRHFIAETWAQMSRRHMAESMSSSGLWYSKMPPLISVVDGSLPAMIQSEGRSGHTQELPPSSPLVVLKIWKKILESHLVVGVDVKNNSARSLSNISLSITCTSQSRPILFESVCSRGGGWLHTSSDPSGLTLESDPSLHQQGSPARKKVCLTSGRVHCHDRVLDSPSVIAPSCLATVTCSSEVSHIAIGREAEVRLLVFASYIEDPKMTTENLPRGGALIMSDTTSLPVPLRREQYCGEVVVMTSDLMEETVLTGSFSLAGSASDDAAESGQISLQDLQALDCLQTCTVLSVQSVVTSVRCLVNQVQAHPSLSYIVWADQYVFTGVTSLRFCRIRVLPQTSKCRGTILVYARSDHLTILCVKFLYSLLPGDVKLVPCAETSQSTSSLSSCRVKMHYAAEAVLADVDAAAADVRHKLAALSFCKTPSDQQDVVAMETANIPQETDDDVTMETGGHRQLLVCDKVQREEKTQQNPQTDGSTETGQNSREGAASHCAHISSTGSGDDRPGANSCVRVEEERENLKKSRKRLREKFKNGAQGISKHK
ncbi:uncharacterized protein LOC101858389 [Aplysia californica]|uniref:Uncharacterized protein LOC101858389 n=1 Tax=Aplysia californica TaxID=6500 RepID=A0ABM0JGA9_APLCA|nr:uncharacterized protein LOC101858389 [Aplysia californica]